MISTQVKAIYTRRGLKRAAIFGFHAALAAALAREWLAYLSQLSVVPEDMRFNLSQKIFRPYLRRRFGAAQRAEILRAHYDLYMSKFGAGAGAFLQQPGVRLAQLMGKSGATYSVYLGLSTTKEGDADIFYMDDKTGAPLATLTGVFGPDGFYIGGLRGIKPPLGKAEIVFATRDLHGLRPKHAVLHAACTIAEWFGATAIFAPTQRNHITWRFGFSSREILADYDAFWQEFTNLQRADGDYILPLQLPRRAAEDVKSKKRSEWLKRQAHLDEMAAQAQNSLNSVASAVSAR